jgi:hypothetical protein
MANVLNYAKTGFGLALGFSILMLISIVISITTATLLSRDPNKKNV